MCPRCPSTMTSPVLLGCGNERLTRGKLLGRLPHVFRQVWKPQPPQSQVGRHGILYLHSRELVGRQALKNRMARLLAMALSVPSGFSLRLFVLTRGVLGAAPRGPWLRMLVRFVDIQAALSALISLMRALSKPESTLWQRVAVIKLHWWRRPRVVVWKY